MQNEIQLLDKAQRQPLGDGLNWLNQSWYLLKKRFGKWLLVGGIFLLLNIGVWWILNLLAKVSGVPFVFNFIGTIFSTFMSAGLILAIASHAEHGDFKIAHLFSGFQLPVKKMVLLSVMMYLPILWINLLSIEQITFYRVQLWLLLSCLIGLMLPLMILHELELFSALKLGISGSLKNIFPIFGFIFSVYFVLSGFTVTSGFILIFVFGEWLVILMPYVMILVATLFVFMSGYFAYRNIWTNSPLK